MPRPSEPDPRRASRGQRSPQAGGITPPTLLSLLQLFLTSFNNSTTTIFSPSPIPPPITQIDHPSQPPPPSFHFTIYSNFTNSISNFILPHILLHHQIQPITSSPTKSNTTYPFLPISPSQLVPVGAWLLRSRGQARPDATAYLLAPVVGRGLFPPLISLFSLSFFFFLNFPLS